MQQAIATIGYTGADYDPTPGVCQGSYAFAPDAWSNPSQWTQRDIIHCRDLGSTEATTADALIRVSQHLQHTLQQGGRCLLTGGDATLSLATCEGAHQSLSTAWHRVVIHLGASDTLPDVWSNTTLQQTLTEYNPQWVFHYDSQWLLHWPAQQFDHTSLTETWISAPGSFVLTIILNQDTPACTDSHHESMQTLIDQATLPRRVRAIEIVGYSPHHPHHESWKHAIMKWIDDIFC